MRGQILGSRTWSLPSNYRSMSSRELEKLRRTAPGWALSAFGSPTMAANTLTQAIADAKKRETNKTSSNNSSSSGLYGQAQKELEAAKALYQSGGAYDQAFDASKRKAMAGAQASLVGMGMANVYNPQASGAAFESENRGNWEMNRTQGLAGAMSNMANLYAGRGSEQVQGQLSRDLTGMQTDASLAATGMQTDASLAATGMNNARNLKLKQMKLNGSGGGGALPSSPFANLGSMWG